MKYKFLVLLSLLFLTFVSSGQSLNKETPNGYNIFYYPNGQISSEGLMKDNNPDGLWKSYYVTGVIKSIGLRNKGALDSVWVFYNEDGNISEKINYFEGKKNGYYYSFDYFLNKDSVKVGYLRSEELYLNNLKNGISNYYYPDGTLQLAVPYREGRKEGIAREFDQDGRLITIIDYRNGKEVDHEFINRYVDSLKDGVWKEFYENGKIKSESNFVRGVLNGLVKEYDKSGKLISVYRYESGNLKDTAIELDAQINIKTEYYNKRDENGELIKKSSGGFIDGKPIGVHRTYDSLGRVNSSRLYDENGNLIGEGIVSDEGDKVGDWTYFYSTGIPKSKGRYHNNYRVGNWSYFYSNGKREQEGYFSNGYPEGVWTWYYENGSVERTEDFKSGKEEGEIKEFDEYGNVTLTGQYVDGLKEGVWFYNYDINTQKGPYKNDLKDGLWQYFYKTGKLYFEGDFVQGNPNGWQTYYYQNGKIKERRYYQFGRKEKNWEYYDYYGTLLKVLTFEDNKLIKIDGISVETE